jgi:hypothetical protein
MSRTILCVALSLAVLYTAFCDPSLAAEPRSKDTAAESKARESVLAALAAEAACDNERRTELLTEARQLAPDLAEANWHLARVKLYGGWLPLADAEAVATSDANRTKYDELRDKASDAKEIRDLARWCQKNGYRDRARLHYAQVLAHAAADADMKSEAVKELDLQKLGDAWLTREEFEARKAEARATEAAVTKWGPRLKRLQMLIDSDDFKRRDAAIAEFHQIDDPALIAVLPLMMSEAGDRFQEEAVKRLAGFGEYEATVALTKVAVLSEYGFVRTAAARELGKRPLHEFVPILLGGLTAPFKMEYQIRWDRTGRISYTSAVLREGPSGNLLLVSQGLSVPRRVFSPPVVDDQTVRVYAPEVPKSTKIVTRSGKTAAQAFAEQLQVAQSQAAIDQSRTALANASIADANKRLFDALAQSTNQQLPYDPLQWWSWWQDYNQYQWPRPTAYVYQSSAQTYLYGISQHTQVVGTRGYSCFVAGTQVRTETGTTPVQSIQAGDRVLAQDQDTGELAYKVVLATTIRPPTKTLTITAGEERLTTTLGHPFWVNGEGWKMAKELAAGDALHTLTGSLKIEKIETAPDAPAYNLVVDDFNTYFVGHQGLLVHDNNFRRPTRAIVPGLVRK